MRNYVALAAGQIWRSADPRRQFTQYFTIVCVRGNWVDVRGSRTGRVGMMARAAFYTTGTRGYVRES